MHPDGNGELLDLLTIVTRLLRPFFVTNTDVSLLMQQQYRVIYSYQVRR